MYLVFTTNFIFCVYDSLRQRLLVFPIPCLQGGNTTALPVQSLFSLFSCIAFSICINCICIHCIPHFLFTRRQHHRLASAIFILSSGIYNSHLRDHQVTVRILTEAESCTNCLFVYDIDLTTALTVICVIQCHHLHLFIFLNPVDRTICGALMEQVIVLKRIILCFLTLNHFGIQYMKSSLFYPQSWKDL